MTGASLAFISGLPIHVNLLLLLGIAIFGGTVGARLFKKMHIPQVVGYIVIGLILGESGLKLFPQEMVAELSPFNFFALGIIGFMIGGELRRDVFRKHGKRLIIILLAEGLSAFVVVGFLTGLVSYLFSGDVRQSVAMGILLGAISSATAPAATANVIWEYRAGGPLTTCVLAIVALDDGLALMLYGLATSVADSVLGQGSVQFWVRLAAPVYKIMGAVVLGILGGVVLHFVLGKIRERDSSLAFAIGAMVAIIGVALTIDVDLILATMCLGLTVANLAPGRSRRAFDVVGAFAPPIYVLFFVLVGAGLSVAEMPMWVWALAIAYVAGRTVGKMVGANLGGRWSGATQALRRYLGLCLFSQGGVAIGLAILASQHFPEQIGPIVIIVVTATTLAVELIGPPCVKLAIQNAGEAGMNITVEDLIESYTAADAMEKEPVVLKEEMTLQQVLRVFSEHDSLCYTVVDRERRLKGLVSFQQIKDTLTSGELQSLLLAHDIMEPARATTTPDAPLKETLDRMRELELEGMAVVSGEGDGKLVGFLDRGLLMRHITAEIARRHEKMTA